jgi:hypothetical protein
VDKLMAELIAKAIGINDAADGFLVRLLAKANGIDDTNDEELTKMLADTKRANHRDVLSLKERMRARTKKGD